MSRVRRFLFAIALSVFGVGIVSSGIYFNAEAGDGQRPKGRTAVSGKTAVSGLVNPVINELDADQAGTDAAEFVEIKVEPGQSLNGFVLVFYTGSTDTSYASFDLDGLVADGNGLVIVGNVGVPGVDLTFAGNILQQGEDAIALYVGDATGFPNGTAVTATNLVDAVVYDTADPDDPGLLTTLLNPGFAQIQIDEASGAGGSAVNGIERCLPGTRDGRSFVVRPPSPNVPNLTCQDTNVDMNGDRRTDFVINRTGSSAANAQSRFATRVERRMQRLRRSSDSASLAGGGAQYEWWIDYNNAPGGIAGVWGLFGVDDLVSADFDGDDTDDVAVWRPGVPGEAGFYSINSSDGTFRYSDFGLEGDDASVVGDYDGDGIDDPATFRCPETPGQCFFFFRGSLNNPTNGITYNEWGFGVNRVDFFPNPGDFDGDGKYDFCLQDARNSGQATFWLRLNGTETVEATQWGLDTDFVVPGDYDGDGKSDYCVMRIEADDRLVFYILERDGGTRAVQWGIFPDVPAPGDYDGDGKQDIAVHRWNDIDTTFWILPSNGDPYWTFNYGLVGDEPLAAWYVQ